MPRPKEVKMVHTETGQEASMLETTVPAWERNGWTVADDGSSEEVVVEQAGQAVPTQAPEQTKANEELAVSKPESVKRKAE